jgi:hypothetical protein
MNAIFVKSGLCFFLACFFECPFLSTWFICSDNW